MVSTSRQENFFKGKLKELTNLYVRKSYRVLKYMSILTAKCDTRELSNPFKKKRIK